MTDEQKIANWKARYNIIKARGRSNETRGVLRKLQRKIDKAEQGIILA